MTDENWDTVDHWLPGTFFCPVTSLTVSELCNLFLEERVAWRSMEFRGTNTSWGKWLSWWSKPFLCKLEFELLGCGSGLLQFQYFFFELGDGSRKSTQKIEGQLASTRHRHTQAHMHACTHACAYIIQTKEILKYTTLNLQLKVNPGLYTSNAALLFWSFESKRQIFYNFTHRYSVCVFDNKK